MIDPTPDLSALLSHIEALEERLRKATEALQVIHDNATAKEVVRVSAEALSELFPSS